MHDFKRNNLQERYRFIRDLYNKNPFPSLEERKNILNHLKESIIKNEREIYNALSKDYTYRSDFDTFVADILPSVICIKHSLKNLKNWMKPSKRRTGIILFPSTISVHYQPLGVIGIIVPWNFPIFLAIAPAVQALAAGNRVMIKMSEFTPNTNKILRDIIKKISEHISIIEGGSDIGVEFSKIPFNHLVFTGSTTVGRFVAQEAAKNLTPVTLELGGKSPVIVSSDANINMVVDTIIFGKILNSGQICVSPDYIFLPEDKEEIFIQKFKSRYLDYYSKNPVTSIINDKQYQRLIGFLGDATHKGANIHFTKEISSDKNILHPVLVTNLSKDMNLLKEEIFGPILPIITYKETEWVVDYINSRAKPLALYIMCDDEKIIDYILKHTHSGGVCINDTIIHAIADDAPFGGIGASGMGHYHGFEGFCTFSKAKTILKSQSWLPRNTLLLKKRNLISRILHMLFLR